MSDATTAVQTDTGDTGNDAPATGSVLTNEAVVTDESQAAAIDSEVVADAAADDAAVEGNPDGSDAGAEGSQLAPDTYADFVMPEGMQLDEPVLTEAAAMFKEDGLTQEKAQKYIDLYAKQVQAGSQKQVDDFNQLMNDWRTQSENDSEFGGDKFAENVKIAQAAISNYGTPELKQLLEEHGVGNHPEVIRFMVRIGHTLKEDVPGNSDSAPSTAQDRVSILYPNSDKA